MARRGDIRLTDLINTGSNLYQNRQMAKQSAILEEQTAAQWEMNRQLARQAEMEEMRENKRQNIIEARKTVIKLGEFSEKAVEVSESYPEYSYMMTNIAQEMVEGTGLGSDFFEEISDMERASEMNKKLDGAAEKIRGSMEQDQISDAGTMRRFLDVDEDALRELESHCLKRESWSKNKAEFEELTPLHKYHSGWRGWVYTLGLPVVLFFLALIVGAILGGDCVAYDSDDYCEEYENDEMVNGSIFAAMAGACVGWYPGSRWGRKYLNQWQPLDEERQSVEAIEERFNKLSSKYGSETSTKTAEIRLDTLGWIKKMVPTGHLGMSLDIAGVVESGIRKNHFDDLDTNHDGVISREEFSAVGGGSEEMFDKLDTNEDGVLDEDEFSEFDEFDEFDAFDTDED